MRTVLKDFAYVLLWIVIAALAIALLVGLWRVGFGGSG